jgi:hypothetical protein
MKGQIKKRIKYYFELIANYKKEIDNESKFIKRSQIIKYKINNIEKNFTLFNIKGQLKFNEEYKLLKDELNNISKKQIEIPKLKLKLMECQKQKNKLESDFKNLNELLVKEKKEKKEKKAKAVKNEKKLNKESLKQINNSIKVEKFKKSTGGSSSSLTSRMSIWTVKK